MRKSLPLNKGDLVKVVLWDFQRVEREGTITTQDNGDILNKDGNYKIDFHNGFVGWHSRKNIRIIKRSCKRTEGQLRFKNKT